MTSFFPCSTSYLTETAILGNLYGEPTMPDLPLQQYHEGNKLTVTKEEEGEGKIRNVGLTDTQVGKQSETTVHINPKPCHLCRLECVMPITNTRKNVFLLNLLTLKSLLCPCYQNVS